jgi:triphosphoribosyl-dephospho-CoA synthase
MTLVLEAPSRHSSEHRTSFATARAHDIARAAIASLHAELVLAPKPGLVCPGDRGSHTDMDATTMMKSIVALRHGFKAIAIAAADGASFASLQAIGIESERVMFAATGGVNTHRGAIFNLGLIAAAAARCASQGRFITTTRLREVLRDTWGSDVRRGAPAAASHGVQVAARYGAGGARHEAAEGFPTVFDVLWPSLCNARQRGYDARRARIHVLMTSIATTADTNLLYRGGAAGLAYAQRAASIFLERGGVEQADWEAELRTVGEGFVARKLSPGGSADLLAATLLVDRLTGPQ